MHTLNSRHGSQCLIENIQGGQQNTEKVLVYLSVILDFLDPG